MQTIYIDIANKGVLSTIYAKQGDVGRKFLVVLSDAGVPYSPPAGSVFSVWYEGDSGEGNYTDIGDVSAFSVNGNKVTVELITQMLAVTGEGLLCLVLNGADGSQIASWNITYFVESVPGASSEQANDYYTAFSRAVENLPYPDTSLSTQGKAADAAAVGAALTTKAPAGYGLGNDSQPVDNFDNITATGMYNGGLDVGQPNTVNGWTCLHIGGKDYAVQNCWQIDADNAFHIIRTKFAGVCSEWEWVNPPMTVGVEYRTTERWNGKVVYTTLINPGVLANDMLSVSHKITMTTPISCVAFVDGEHTIPAKYKDADYDQEVTAYATYQKTFIYSNGMIESVGKNVYCILKYLKD